MRKGSAQALSAIKEKFGTTTKPNTSDCLGGCMARVA
jgi:hypothetical protein